MLLCFLVLYFHWMAMNLEGEKKRKIILPLLLNAVMLCENEVFLSNEYVVCIFVFAYDVITLYFL